MPKTPILENPFLYKANYQRKRSGIFVVNELILVPCYTMMRPTGAGDLNASSGCLQTNPVFKDGTLHLIQTGVEVVGSNVR